MTDNGNMIMPVSPMYGNYGMGGNGMFGNDGAWWLLILLFCMGGWGNGFGANGGNGGVMPYLWNNDTRNDVNRGFADAGLSNQLSGIQSSISNGFANAEVASCNRAMDAMNQRFSDSLSLLNSLNTVNSSLQQCCCENRASVADLKYTVATEACADRQAVTDALAAVLNQMNVGVQSIKDQMCQDKIDAKNEKITELQNQLNMANFRESQTTQNALFAQGMNNEVDALYNRLKNCPVPSMPVYSQQPIFTCGGNGCGCNGGNF